MRKLRTKAALLLAAVLLVSAMGGSVLAAEAGAGLRVEAAKADSALTLSVVANAATRSGELTLGYDPAALRYEETATDATVHSLQAEEGTVRFGYACSAEDKFDAGETVAELHFTVLTSDAFTTVELCVESLDGSEQIDPAEKTKLTVTLNSAPGVIPSAPEPSEEPTGGLPFVDVPEDIWYYEAVEYVFTKGYFEGTSDITFSPNLTMDRAMFVTVLGRMAGVTPDDGANTGFSDVEAGSYYAGYVAWGAQNGIIEGTSETTFSPHAPVTREMMAAFLCRYARYQGCDVTADESAMSSFADADEVSEWARPSMAWAVASGVIIGTDEGLEPLAGATRAQVARIVLNYSLFER